MFIYKVITVRLIAVGYAKWYAKWYAISSRKKNIAYRMEYCLARAVGVLYMVRQIHSNWAIGEDSPLSGGLGGHLFLGLTPNRWHFALLCHLS